jgi:membrane protein DedA with SNARE-associated domain
VVINASIVSYILDRILHLPGGLVFALVALLVFGEAALFIGFVLPGETSVIVAGVVASQGHINIDILCVLVVVAAIVGDSVGYAIGHRYGEKLMTLPLIRNRRVALERALEGLRRRGPIYVFVGRFTAFLRAVMPGLAGMSKMHYRRFLVANALGGIIWGVGFSLLGYFAGGALLKIEKYASWAGIALLVLIIGFFVAMHVRRKRLDQRDDAAWMASHPNENLPKDFE